MTQQTYQDSAHPKMNRLLAILEPGDYDALMQHAKVVLLKLRKHLHQQDERVDAVYFPITSMVSLLVKIDGKPQMEMATVGKEGAIGASELLQATQAAMCMSLVQLPGKAVRIDADSFRDLMKSRPQMQRRMQEHQYALMRQILYAAACNLLHNMEQRCARWILMTQDRAGKDTFPLTQEFLSHMLGVRRATVNLATGTLRKAGFIRYVRGTVTVVDRAGLESAVCTCYRKIVRLYEFESMPAPAF